MHLHSALEQIASAYSLDANALIAYAAEDTETGWDHGEGEWPTGSIWQVEGQVLYALVRALKPSRVVELGTWYGCSATHLLLALAVNDSGILIAVDNHVQGGPQTLGEMIPHHLRGQLIFRPQSILDYLTTTDDHPDLIFEDGMHDQPQVEAVWRAGQQCLTPGGIMISHDATHFVVGEDVRRGIEQAGISDALYLAIDPSDCGLAVWKKPGELTKSSVPAKPSAPPAPRPKSAPKRKRKGAA